MAANGRLRVVLGLTGEEAADRDALAIRDAPAPALVTANPPPPARAQTRALPDAEEEARYAVRRIFAQLAQRPAARLDRIAVTYRVSVPYARLISEQLAARTRSTSRTWARRRRPLPRPRRSGGSWNSSANGSSLTQSTRSRPRQQTCRPVPQD
jgi:hypothetical protein